MVDSLEEWPEKEKTGGGLKRQRDDSDDDEGPQVYYLPAGGYTRSHFSST